MHQQSKYNWYMYMYVWFFITNLLHSLFAKIPEITNDLILEVAFRKLEKLPSLNYFIDKYTKQKS